MNAQDEELIRKFAAENAELKELLDEHVLYEKKLEKLELKPFLTPDEQQEVAKLKKLKLNGKTRMFEIMDMLRKA